MGCFTVLKSKKKKIEQPIRIKPINHQDNTPTTLPEPQSQSRSLQSAPPSFRTRAKPVQSVNLQSANRVSISRTRALSAPSSLHVADEEAFSSIEYDEQEEAKLRAGLAKDQRAPSPQPLPLPSPQTGAVLKNMGSFKSSNASGPIFASGPLPLPPLGGLRNFPYDEIAAACQHFSPERCVSEGLSSMIYKASFGDDASGSKKLDATVTRLLPSTQGYKEFVNEINTLTSLQHPQLCKLIGFHAREGTEQRMLVYERLYHGSLDRLLYGRSDGPPIDWSARMKVALCAAQGLAFLHEEGPFQAMYNEFSTANVQVDKDFSAKLSGYGCVCHNPDADITNTSTAIGNVSVETLERGLLTPKSNVWSFGIVLLELLTGRRNLDSRNPKEERNLVKWSRPFLADDSRLSLIMDPRLKGRFPPKAARTVADIALKCLQMDPSERPTMRIIVESLKNIQDLKYPSRFPLQEPAAVAGKQMSRSPSLNNMVTPAPRLSFSPSPSSIIRPSVSPTRPSVPSSLPPRSCSSMVSLEVNPTNDSRKRSSSVRRSGVEGF
ncbi:protein kinase superfamily protein [Tasmannia lanceolata]|uniref:protein kinase superfamily protein n=1 Tax=Tasmannia lanceolata TaxID=3420 RepID=UPI004062BB2E